MSENPIRLSRDGAIATLTIHRPERRNAITNEMMEEIERTARSFALDEKTRAIIIRAEGNDFSVGADLSQPRFQGDPQSMLMRRRGLEIGGLMMRALQEIHQPTICAIKGVSTGGGACIPTACDFRIAADTTRAGYGEVKMGINLMWNAVPVCVNLIGPARAKRMIMSGKLFDAATLLNWGFVDEVVPVADLDATAHAWAEEYAALPPIAVQMIKRSINKYTGALDNAIMHMDADQWLLTAHSEDMKEAISSFFEKRKPTYKGN
jgi:enoyl-CoA hydratase/carnithine racemase